MLPKQGLPKADCVQEALGIFNCAYPDSVGVGGAQDAAFLTSNQGILMLMLPVGGAHQARVYVTLPLSG